MAWSYSCSSQCVTDDLNKLSTSAIAKADWTTMDGVELLPRLDDVAGVVVHHIEGVLCGKIEVLPSTVDVPKKDRQVLESVLGF